MNEEDAVAKLIVAEKWWEDLCDGCALCCRSGVDQCGVEYACPKLGEDRRCTVYSKRLSTEMCVKVSPSTVGPLHAAGILPASCAYVRHAKGQRPYKLPLENVRPLIAFDLAPRPMRRRHAKAKVKWLAR